MRTSLYLRQVGIVLVSILVVLMAGLALGMATPTLTRTGQERATNRTARMLHMLRWVKLSSITSLCCFICPATITRRIGTVVVDPVDAEVWVWPQAHVTQKDREIVAPFFAHHDSTPAVIFEMDALGIMAAFLRTGPRAVFRTSTLDPGMAVAYATGRLLPCEVTPKAAATDWLASAENVLSDQNRCATVASATPERSITYVSLVGRPFHQQSPVAMSGEV